MKRGVKIVIVVLWFILAIVTAVFAVHYMEQDSGQSSTGNIGGLSGEQVKIEATIVATPTAVPTETLMHIVPTATGTPTPTSTPTPTNTPTPTPSPTPVVVEIVISAAGDVTLGNNQKQSYKNTFHEAYDLYGEDYFLESVKDIFEADDFTIVNLECVLTNSENIRASKEWNMKGPPEYVRIIKNASVEAVSLGNNHIMDYQWEGVNDTFKTVSESGIEYAISSPWGDRYGMYETEKGIKIGFVSVNEYYDGKAVYAWLEDGYHELRGQGADLVFACMHWGGDKVYEPEPEQLELGHWLADLGYDLVLGCHPHVIQGIEYYNGTYIVHSMGNFCYGGHMNPLDKDSMIFQQTFTFVDGVLQEETKIRAIPCSLSSVNWRNDFKPTPLSGEAAKIWVSHLNQYSERYGLVFDAEGYPVETGNNKEETGTVQQ